MTATVLPPKYVGEAIRRFRRRAGLTQEELAGKTEINPTSISRYERGKSQVGNTNLKKICAALACLPEQLFAFAWEISEEESGADRFLATAEFPAAELERIYEETAHEWKSLYIRTCRALFDAVSGSRGNGPKVPPKVS
jgi:transcriptional regulator with XRE-family HTH domain